MRELISEGGGSEVKFERNAETPLRDETSEALVEGARTDCYQYMLSFKREIREGLKRRPV